MATSMNTKSHQEKSPVGLLLIVGEIISNEQRADICVYLHRALQNIDNNKYHEINDLFNNLIHENEFQADSQYRQMANTENGSIAGFIYLPNFHTLLNVLKDLFNMCYHVCIIFCGQQIDTNGALILSDSVFTCDNFYSLFEDNPSSVIQDLQIILPFVSNQWIRLSNNYLQKHLHNVQMNDLSHEKNEENAFGELFYERLYEVLNKDSINFDIYKKLIPRENSGTIAFDEPNLYILYGQQGEASLFGIRGFVVLVNGGFSRIPSYWNLIRGLQNIDACILTHFDYDVFPGLQTILHRKTIPSTHNDQLCKPDIGAIFLNYIQRTKIQSIPLTKSSTNSKLSVNLNENIDQFLNDVKQLNIDTFDLVKPTTSNKSIIESMNLYKKIAFGSLDLYILHPTAAASEDEKVLASLQKIPIRNQQPSSSIIPFHHWYSSCLLLVWTPTSKSSKDSLVRILYTGACPQTLVFEALGKVRHLEVLHESQRQRTGNVKTTSSANTSAGVNHPPQKPKVSPAVANRVAPSTTPNKTSKVLPRPVIPKPKTAQTTPIKSGKPRSTPSPKKTPPPTTSNSARLTNKDKKAQKPRRPASKSTAKPEPVKNPIQKLKPQKDPKQKVVIQNGHKEESKIRTDYEQKTETQIEDQEELVIENEHEQKLETVIDEELKLETPNDEHEQSNEIEEISSFPNDHEEQIEEKSEYEMSADELDDNNETPIENHDDDIKRPDSISLPNGHNEPLIESNTESPIDEIKSQLSPHDPMTMGFVEGGSDAQNPFIETTADTDDDEIEIIHHDISISNKQSMPAIEDINPQGLPIENNFPSGKSTNKTSTNRSNRTNGSSPSTTNSTHIPSHKSKPTPPSGSIFHVDVAYIPYHGNEHYVDSEFFRRIRARYYILNAVQINRLTLESLIDGKQQWEKNEHVPVTLVPTFDGEQLRQFFVTHKNRLAELNINILPASTRCNVQYDDEGSPAQRLRFSSIYNTDEQ